LVANCRGFEVGGDAGGGGDPEWGWLRGWLAMGGLEDGDMRTGRLLLPTRSVISFMA
jgi:hypothetical protein